MVDRNRLAQLIKLEEEEFDRLHPTSKTIYINKLLISLLSGVPSDYFKTFYKLTKKILISLKK